MKKLSSIFFKPSLDVIYRYAVAKKHPILCALLFIIGDRRNYPLDVFLRLLGKRRKKRVICLSRQIFLYDIEILQEHTADIVFLHLSSRICKNVFTSYFPPPISLTDEEYLLELASSEKYQMQADNLCKFWESFFETLRRMQLVDCVMNTNWVYALSYEVNRACVNINIPYLVYFKESMKTNYGNQITVQRKWGGIEFLGTRMFFNSESARKIYSEVSGVSNRNSETVGWIRADRLVAYGKQQQKCKKMYSTILFIDDPWAYIGKWPKEYPRAEIIKKVEKVYKLFFCLARDFPEKNFVVKLKHQYIESYLVDFLDRYTEELSTNITVVPRGDPFELIKQSDTIIGFGSTVELEAIALDVPVIEPYTVPPDDPILLFGKFDGVVNYVDEMNTMVDIVLNPDRYLAPREARLKALEHYFGYFDGLNTNRLTKALLSAMD